MINGIFDTAIQLPLPEFILIVLGTLITGFSIGFLWLNRKGGDEALKLKVKRTTEDADQWRLKYYDQTESKEKALNELNESLKQLEEKEEQQAVEIEELTLLNQQLMLKQKNASAQQKNLIEETELLKLQISENERVQEALKKEHQELLEDLENAKKVIQEAPDKSIMEAIEKELKQAEVKIREIEQKTRNIENLYSDKHYEPIIAVDNPIIDNISSWGMDKLRKELERLSNQNSLLEHKLNRLSQLEELYENEQKK